MEIKKREIEENADNKKPGKWRRLKEKYGKVLSGAALAFGMTIGSVGCENEVRNTASDAGSDGEVSLDVEFREVEDRLQDPEIIDILDIGDMEEETGESCEAVCTDEVEEIRVCEETPFVSRANEFEEVYAVYNNDTDDSYIQTNSVEMTDGGAIYIMSFEPGLPICESEDESCENIGLQNVDIRFLGETWEIGGLEDGRLDLHKIAVAGLLNVGEGLIYGNYVFKFEGSGVHNGETVAIVRMYDQSCMDTPLHVESFHEGQTKAMIYCGESIYVRVGRVAPTYTIDNSWAELSILSRKIELMDGQVPDMSNDRWEGWEPVEMSYNEDRTQLLEIRMESNGAGIWDCRQTTPLEEACAERLSCEYETHTITLGEDEQTTIEGYTLRADRLLINVGRAEETTDGNACPINSETVNLTVDNIETGMSLVLRTMQEGHCMVGLNRTVAIEVFGINANLGEAEVGEFCSVANEQVRIGFSVCRD